MYRFFSILLIVINYNIGFSQITDKVKTDKVSNNLTYLRSRNPISMKSTSNFSIITHEKTRNPNYVKSNEMMKLRNINPISFEKQRKPLPKHQTHIKN